MNFPGQCRGRQIMLSSVLRSVGCIPLAAGLSITAGLVISYIIAVRLGHVYPFLPYVSDTGALQPESSVFSLLLTVSCILIGITIYLRYKQIASQCQDGPNEVLSWNNKSVTPGCLATIGLCIVANCQEDLRSLSSLQTLIHSMGAGMCFGAGVVYGWYQSRISYALSTEVWSLAVALSRYILTALTAFFFVTTFPLASVAFDRFNGTFAQHMHWRPEDKGYVLHICSAMTEYLMSYTFVLFIVTFCLDLRSARKGL